VALRLSASTKRAREIPDGVVDAPARWAAALCAALALVATAACGPEPTPVETRSPTTLPEGVPVPAPATSRGVEPPTSASTAPPRTATPEVRTIPLGTSFQLAVAGTVAVAGERLTVGYNRLLSDSRCPLDVQCITAGNAAVAITLAKVELVDLGRGPSPTARLRVR